MTVVIAPWNFPLAIPTGMVAAALVTGNPGSVQTPLNVPRRWATNWRRSCLDAGVPKGLLQYVPGAAARARVGRIGRWRKTIAFTGSKDDEPGHHAGGCGSAARATVVKRVIAEMGGKMPSSSMRRLISMKP